MDAKTCKNSFFIQLLNAWLYFINCNFPTPTSIEIILEQSIFLNPHTKLDFCCLTGLLDFYCFPYRNVSDKFTIIRQLCKFTQPVWIYSATFNEKLGFPTDSHERIYKLIMELIPNDWKHLLRTDTSHKSLLKSSITTIKALGK